MTGTVAAGLATLALISPGLQRQDDVTLPGAVVVHEELRDVQPDAAGPMDGAKALLVMVSAGGGTTVLLQIVGADPGATGRR